MNYITTGWLSPNGEFYETDVYYHIEKAYDLVKKYKYSNLGEPIDDTLMNHGWVQITRGQLFDHDYHIYWHGGLRLANGAFEFLRQWFENPDISWKIHHMTITAWEREVDKR